MPNKGLGMGPKGMGSVHPKCRCQTRASSQGNGFSPSQVLMPNKGLVPREWVQSIPSVDAKQGPRPKGISSVGMGSVHPKCRCQTRASSQGNQFSPSQVSMPNKGLVPRESVQSIPSVDAKQGPRPKGISSGYPKCRCQIRASSQGPRPKGMGSVHPKCRCQTRASSQGNQFSPSQVSMPNKGLVPRESVQVIPSVDAKQGPPKSSSLPKCRCQTRASSQGNQFRPSQVSMTNKGLVPRESVQAFPSVDAKQGLRPKGISSGLPKCQWQTRASSQGNQFSPSQDCKVIGFAKFSLRVVLLIYSSLRVC